MTGETCEWFLRCDAVAYADVEHPTLGPVAICERHLDWLLEDGNPPSPTKMIPPMVARRAAEWRART